MKLPLLVGLLLMMFRVAGQSPCQPPTSYTELEVNNVRAGLLNGGDLWWDLNEARYEVPKGGGVSALFTGGLWLGGLDTNGDLRVAAAMYRQIGTDYWPGPLGIDDAATEPVCLAYDRFWRVNQSEIDQFDQLSQQHLSTGDSIPLHLIPNSIRDWPASGNPFARGKGNVPLQIPVSKDLAPYVDVDGNPGYDPIKGDYPKIRGEETVWWVFNDAGDIHYESGGEPLRVEVKALAYAVGSVSYLQETTFYNFEITNYGSDLDSTFIGIHADGDIGDPADDFAGCDTSRDLGITYNADDEDGPSSPNYGSDPPMVAVDLLRGPMGDSGKRQGMDAFMIYTNDYSVAGIPELPIHFYQYMQTRFKDNTPVLIHNQPQKHVFPDEPDDPMGWSECSAGNNPFDRRMILASGPLSFPKGETKCIDFAAIWNQCPRPVGCPPFDCIQITSDAVQTWFDTSHPPVGIELNKPKAYQNLKIHPNPTTDHVTIQWSEPMSDEAMVKVVDLKGKVVYESNIASGAKEHPFSVSNFVPGVYLIQLTSKGGLIQTAKLMVTR